MNLKSSLVLKPNDLILVIGKPTVLMNIYNVIGKTQGQFICQLEVKFTYIWIYI